MSTSNPSRPLRYESLEDRCVLSATGLGADAHDHECYCATEEITEDYSVNENLDWGVNSLTLLINGTDTYVYEPGQNLLELAAGDTVEVVDIAFDTTATEGVFAAEGYLTKPSDLNSATMIDYNDGRFSGGALDFEANGGAGSVQGLNGAWTVDEGWDRMTINLMHYTANDVDVAGRFFLNMQVGQPDFSFNTEVFDKFAAQEFKAGHEVVMPVEWMNNLSGRFHNYAEADVYHADDLNTIIWAGASAGTPGDAVIGNFENTREGDGFTQHWVPCEPGEYVIKFTVDPEKLTSEADESNNEYEVTITVLPCNDPPVAEDDKFEAENGGEVIGGNLMENDSDPNGHEIKVDDFTQPENGKVKVDAEGNFKYVAENGYVGTDKFTYTVSDEMGMTDEATVYVNVSEAESGIKVLSSLPDTTEMNFQANDDLKLTFTNEQQYSWGFGLQNNSGEVVENWAVEITNANYKIDASQLSNSDAFELTTTQNDDGTYNHLFVGTSSIDAYGGIPGGNIEWHGVNFGQSVSSDGFSTGTATMETYANLEGKEDSKTAIPVEIDTDRYTHLLVSGVPEGAELNHGERVANGSYLVAATDAANLAVAPAEHSDEDFMLTLTPVNDGQSFDDMAEKVKVEVHAVLDRTNWISVQNFGMLTGTSGNIPMEYHFSDTDGSEIFEIRFEGLPDHTKLSAGELQRDGSWLLSNFDLENLQITADQPSDFSDWQRYSNSYYYQKLAVTVTGTGTEQSTGETNSGSLSFDLYIYHRR